MLVKILFYARIFFPLNLSLFLSFIPPAEKIELMGVGLSLVKGTSNETNRTKRLPNVTSGFKT